MTDTRAEDVRAEVERVLVEIDGEWELRPFEASTVDGTAKVLDKPVRAVAVAEGKGHRWITTACERNAEFIAAAPRLLRALLKENRELREALTWVVNVGHGVGKAGGEPEYGEWEAAIDAGRAALASPASPAAPKAGEE